MKLNLVCVLIVGLLSSCSMQKTRIAIYGFDNSYVELYNGDHLITKDTLNMSPVNDLSKIVNYKYNFSDSLNIIYEENGVQLSKKMLLQKGKYIYVKNLGLDFNAYSSNVDDIGI